MPDNSFAPQGSAVGANCFKEAVCINADRIYDSCSDKDCWGNLPVQFPAAAQAYIDCATAVKCKKVEVLDVFLNTEPIPFNKGFYAVDMTFFFLIVLDAYESPTHCPVEVCGTVVYNKKVILYGSEGNVQVFHSGRPCGEPLSMSEHKTAPKATVQVVDPICLSSHICECKHRPHYTLPEAICCMFEDSFDCSTPPKRTVEVTLGVFSIVSLSRTVQMMVPVYDFSVPDKECSPTNDDPCELFKRIKFPVDEFFPPRLGDLKCDKDCDCGL